MSKRAQSRGRDAEGPLKQGRRPEEDDATNSDDISDYEDDFEDEYEDEVLEVGDEDEADDDDQTFIPGRHKLSAGEVLEPDESTYETLHRLEPPWPCLSFDLVTDHLGDGRARRTWPKTVYAVAGTQAARGHERENELLVMKMSKLTRTGGAESESESEDDEEETDPILETKRIKLDSCTNRIRATKDPHTSSLFPETLTATMAESGAVLIHNITPHLTFFDVPGTIISEQQDQPVHVIKAHKGAEGYAVDWSPQYPGVGRRLLTGDTAGRIFLTTQDASGWTTDGSRPFTGHTSSVEEIQWSPSGVNEFASASADGTVRIWDVRSKSRKPMLSIQASSVDVNVLSWSKLTPYLLASGADDGTWAVWDLRQWKPAGPGNAIQTQEPIASFAFHKEQITSIEWHPTDDSVLSVCAGDNTCTLWDLSVELDDEESKYTADARDVPPQLLFVHYMDQVKEAHFHPQMPGVIMATGGSGFK